MDLSIRFENTPGLPENRGPLTVGWLLDTEKARVIYYPPERVRSVDMNRMHAKSASRCPAVLQLESRFFVVRSPIDLNVGFVRDDKGKAILRNLSGTKSAVRAGKLSEMLSLTPEHEWRYPDRPTLQLSMPYVFISDEPVYMTQLAPFMHYNPNPWPGTIFGGRFPINFWPRSLMWAMEWHDTSKPLVIKRGDPLFYVTFEGISPDRSINLVETEETPELKSYMKFIAGAVNYVNQTFSLFERSAEVRPDVLVKPVKRK